MRVALDTRRRAFTLVELLIAMVIAAIILIVLYATYHTVSSALQGQKNREQTSHAIYSAMQQLRDDLTRTFLPAADPACLFTLRPGTNDATISLSFCRSAMTEDASKFLWSEVEHVTYETRKNQDGTMTLWYGYQPLSGPAAFQPPQTNVLIEKISAMRIEIFDGLVWQPQWPIAQDSKPMAARITMDAAVGANSKKWQTDVFIPAGNTFTTSYQRAAAAPAQL